MMTLLPYIWRRFRNGVLLGHLLCIRPRCGRDRVGFSRFCRGHTDEILMAHTRKGVVVNG